MSDASVLPVIIAVAASAFGMWTLMFPPPRVRRKRTKR